MHDELTPRRERKLNDDRAWFMQEWAYLDADAREAIAALIVELHERGAIVGGRCEGRP
jgi:hypothetical protein